MQRPITVKPHIEGGNVLGTDGDPWITSEMAKTGIQCLCDLIVCRRDYLYIQDITAMAKPYSECNPINPPSHNTLTIIQSLQNDMCMCFPAIHAAK